MQPLSSAKPPSTSVSPASSSPLKLIVPLCRPDQQNTAYACVKSTCDKSKMSANVYQAQYIISVCLCIVLCMNIRLIRREQMFDSTGSIYEPSSWTQSGFTPTAPGNVNAATSGDASTTSTSTNTSSTNGSATFNGGAGTGTTGGASPSSNMAGKSTNSAMGSSSSSPAGGNIIANHGTSSSSGKSSSSSTASPSGSSAAGFKVAEVCGVYGALMAFVGAMMGSVLGAIGLLGL